MVSPQAPDKPGLVCVVQVGPATVRLPKEWAMPDYKPKSKEEIDKLPLEETIRELARMFGREEALRRLSHPDAPPRLRELAHRVLHKEEIKLAGDDLCETIIASGYVFDPQSDPEKPLA